MRAKLPYKELGAKLKQIRVTSKESLAEVSGAVEIDLQELAIFERGENRPPEDILQLLISHFAMKDDEAAKLWKLAGYGEQKATAGSAANLQDNEQYQKVFVAPADAKIIYTDTVHVMVNNYGVVMNFMQGTGNDSQPFIISRVGMSKEHARSVIEILQKTLEASESTQAPKQLPEHTDKNDIL